jgi:hypothetical protein
MNPDEFDLIEQRLRGALAREAISVHPSPAGLQRIRAAIETANAPAPARWPRLWLPLAAAAAVLAFAVITPSLLRGGADSAAPAQVARNSPTVAIVPPLPIYFVARQQERWALVREFEPTVLTDPRQRLEAALRLAVSGRAKDADYTSVWRYEHLTAALPAALADAVTAEQSGSAITVTLAPGLLGTTAEDPALARLAVQQIVWTATATTQQMSPVQISSPVGDARLLGTLPLQSAFARSLADGDPRAPVWISSLVDGQALRVGTAMVTGDAANGTPVHWTLRRTDGDQETEVASGLATPVSDGTPTSAGGRAEWRVEVPLAQPGSYIVEVSIGSWTDTKAVRAIG